MLAHVCFVAADHDTPTPNPTVHPDQVSFCSPSPTLGLDAELYYVRDDVINRYALSFVLPVPSEVNILNFTWHSKSKVGLSTSPPPCGLSCFHAESPNLSDPHSSFRRWSTVWAFRWTTLWPLTFPPATSLPRGRCPAAPQVGQSAAPVLKLLCLHGSAYCSAIRWFL